MKNNNVLEFCTVEKYGDQYHTLTMFKGEKTMLDNKGLKVKCLNPLSDEAVDMTKEAETLIPVLTGRKTFKLYSDKTTEHYLTICDDEDIYKCYVDAEYVSALNRFEDEYDNAYYFDEKDGTYVDNQLIPNLFLDYYTDICFLTKERRLISNIAYLYTSKTWKGFGTDRPCFVPVSRLLMDDFDNREYKQIYMVNDIRYKYYIPEDLLQDAINAGDIVEIDDIYEETYVSMDYLKNNKYGLYTKDCLLENTYIRANSYKAEVYDKDKNFIGYTNMVGNKIYIKNQQATYEYEKYWNRYFQI